MFRKRLVDPFRSVPSSFQNMPRCCIVPSMSIREEWRRFLYPSQIQKRNMGYGDRGEQSYDGNRSERFSQCRCRYYRKTREKGNDPSVLGEKRGPVDHFRFNVTYITGEKMNKGARSSRLRPPVCKSRHLMALRTGLHGS